MPIQSIVLLSATFIMVASLSSTALAALPAGCIDSPSPPQTAAPRWLMLLPTVTVGVDLRPQRELISNHEARYNGLSLPHAPSSQTGVHQAHQDELLRWTLNLSWTGRPSSPRSPRQDQPSPNSSRCQRYLELLALRHSDLSSAIDHWAQTQTLLTLIEQTKPVEVPR